MRRVSELKDANGYDKGSLPAESLLPKQWPSSSYTQLCIVLEASRPTVVTTCHARDGGRRPRTARVPRSWWANQRLVGRHFYERHIHCNYDSHCLDRMR